MYLLPSFAYLLPKRTFWWYVILVAMQPFIIRVFKNKQRISNNSSSMLYNIKESCKIIKSIFWAHTWNCWASLQILFTVFCNWGAWKRATENIWNVQISKAQIVLFIWTYLSSVALGIQSSSTFIIARFGLWPKFQNSRRVWSSKIIIFISLQQNCFRKVLTYVFCFDISWIGVWLWKIYKTKIFKCKCKNNLSSTFVATFPGNSRLCLFSYFRRIFRLEYICIQVTSLHKSAAWVILLYLQ